MHNEVIWKFRIYSGMGIQEAGGQERMKELPVQLDKRTKEDIIGQMEELAAAYTPEWKFGHQYPDVGAVLMNIYGDMLLDMIGRFNLAPERDRLAFLQYLGTRQKPAEPAKGYVSFGMVKGVEQGTSVPKGTTLLGINEQGETIKVETRKDIYVSAGEIKGVYYTDGSQDRIECMAKQEGVIADSTGKNLQEHVCLLGHSTVFSIAGEAELFISFQPQGRKQDWDRLIKNPEKTEFYYCSGQGEWKVEEWSCQDSVIRLKTTKEMSGASGTWEEKRDCSMIRWQVRDIQAYAGFTVKGIRLGAKCAGKKPEYTFTAEGEEGLHRYFPFGERPYAYGEFYICSNEVLGKKGAEIQIRMDMEFRRVSQLVEPVSVPIQWKTIMKQSDFMEEEAVPIDIGEVVWEYYNGTGFTRLFSEPLYTDSFTPQPARDGQEDWKTSKMLEMNLTCPLDIQPFLVNAGQVYCIRARILRMNHAYVRNGYYRTPIVTRMELSFDYQNVMQEPELCCLRNRLEEQWVEHGKTFVPFQDMKELRPAFYIGFHQPLREGPYGLYCGVSQENALQGQGMWNYEYFNGREWKSLVAEDDTEGLKRNGTLLLFGNEDFSSKRLFGMELYWIRMVLIGKWEDFQGVPIQELWWNTVPVLAVETVPEETFTLDGYERPIVCQLKQKNIYEIDVWVKEKSGTAEVWVLWKEADDNDLFQDGGCQYQVDRREGRLLFPDGIKGRLPAKEKGANVKVTYTWGGGEPGNLKEGQICRMDRSIRFIRQVINRHPLTGGRNPETLEEANVRGSSRLLNQDRAVMASDYEALAFHASREVVKARAYSNRNPKGEREGGAVTLVVLQENFQAKGSGFLKLQETVLDYIKSRMPAMQQVQHHVSVIEPWYTEIQVSAVCILKPHDSVFSCKAEIEERLRNFLHPLTGNFDGRGWGIGTAPRREQIRNVLRETKGVAAIQKLVVKAYLNQNHGLQEIDLEGTIPEYTVIVNGTHRIRFEFA